MVYRKVNYEDFVGFVGFSFFEEFFNVCFENWVVVGY